MVPTRRRQRRGDRRPAAQAPESASVTVSARAFSFREPLWRVPGRRAYGPRRCRERSIGVTISIAEKGPSTRVPTLAEEPEVVKFIRLDAVQYEGEWSAAAYDPEVARACLESNIDDIREAERLGFDAVFLTEHHFDGWTL